MNKKLTFVCAFIFAFCLSVGWAIDHEFSFPVVDGVSFQHIQTDATGILRNTSILTIDYNNPDLQIITATATPSTGRKSTPNIEKEWNGIAAINGGYFAFSGVPVGLVVHDGKIIAPNAQNRPPRAAIGFTKSHRVVIDRVEVKDDKLVGMSGTDWSDVTDALGGGPVLVKDGKPSVSWREEHMGLSFNTTHHPRTAVGYTKDNQVIFIVVDGRQKGVAEGISLNELAQYMIHLGCTNAMNLDGGGSSTMSLWDTVVNSVSDGAKNGLPGLARPVTNALVLKRVP